MQLWPVTSQCYLKASCSPNRADSDTLLEVSAFLANAVPESSLPELHWRNMMTNEHETWGRILSSRVYTLRKASSQTTTFALRDIIELYLAFTLLWWWWHTTAPVTKKRPVNTNTLPVYRLPIWNGLWQILLFQEIKPINSLILQVHFYLFNIFEYANTWRGEISIC